MFAARAAFFTGTVKSVTYTGAAVGTKAISATVTLPTHNVGDIIVIFAFAGVQSGVTIFPPVAGGTVPTWMAILSDNNAATYQVRYAVATATNHTSGIWSTGESNMTVAAVVLSGQGATPIGGSAASVTTTALTSVAVPSITMTKTNGSSALLQFAANNSGTSTISVASGYTSRATGSTASSSGGVTVATKDTTTADGSATFTSDTSSASMAVQLEILT